MDYSIATLLSYFVDDKLVAGKFLEKKLGCESPEGSEALQIVLDALERLGVLMKERGKYKRAPQEDVIEAKLRCSSKGFCFAIQDDEDAADIYIREGNLSNAWNGDRVLVKVIKDGTRRKSPEGMVHLILDRANPSLLAQVKKAESDFRAVPLDDRLLFELELQPDGQDLNNAVDHLVHVSVRRYPIAQHPPVGEVTKILGSDAEAAADTDIVCCKHDLPLGWPNEVLEALQALPTAIEPGELKQRQDYRQLPMLTFSDDGKGDSLAWQEVALSLESEQNQWRVGIHITDIDHYIAEDSVLDQIARKRGTAVYLENHTCPLFPDALMGRCSLIPDEDRLALSFFLTVDDQGEVQGFEYHSSVINIDRQFSFSEVQAFLADPDAPSADWQPYSDPLQQLFFHLCPLIKSQRLQRGSFNLQAEQCSPLLGEGRLGTILVQERLPIRALLAEVMVVLQHQVAQQLQALGVPGLYSGQTAPDWEDLTDILKLSENLALGITVDTEADVSSQDYHRLSQAFQSLSSKAVLNHLLAQTLKKSKYFSHPAPHFGLAYQSGYTHCIAPAQRYGDLVIQRLLKLVLREGRDRRTKQMKTGVKLNDHTCRGEINWNVLPPNLQDAIEGELHQLVLRLNDREQIADDAEKDLQGLKKAEKMKARTGQVFRGLITGVQSYGFFVQIFELLAEGLVHVSSLKDDWYEFRGRQCALVGRKNRISYRLGDEVDVQVKSVDYYRQQIDLATVSGSKTKIDDTLDEGDDGESVDWEGGDDDDEGGSVIF
ncbi:MAG: ribonuclease R family protein [Synechocystis sp.]|nr:ribonuclease R family protein [Synechocystis sp.]